MENLAIKCAINEAITIKEAFFTSSIVDQCPFVSLANSNKTTDPKNLPCTDDLRLTINSK